MSIGTSSPLQSFSAQVIRHLPSGLLAQDSNGRQGIVKTHEISWKPEGQQDWRKRFPIGERIKVVEINDSRTKAQAKWSMRIAEFDPWQHLPEWLAVGRVVDGVVTGMVGYGMFVELYRGVAGLLHRSKAPLEYHKSQGELFWPGDQVQVQVQQIDYSQRKISLQYPTRENSPPYDRSQPEKESQNADVLENLNVFKQLQGARLHVLLVEDDVRQAEMISSWLRRVGSRVDPVNTGSLALERIAKNQPDLVLMDIGLPDLSGLQVTSMILERWPHMQVVLMTGDISIELNAEWEPLHHKVLDLLLKPIFPRDLLEVLRRVLDAREQDKLNLPSRGETATREPFADSLSTGVGSLAGLLTQICQDLDYEVAVLFSLDPFTRMIKMSMASLDTDLHMSAVPELIYSPVRDVAEDRIPQCVERLNPDQFDTFKHLLEFYPLTSCLGVPLLPVLSQEHALFLMDRQPHKIGQAEKLYAKSAALILSSMLEREQFHLQAAQMQRTILIGHMQRAMLHEVNNLITPLKLDLINLRGTLQQLKGQVSALAGEAVIDDLGQDLNQIQANIEQVGNTSRVFSNLTARDQTKTVLLDELVRDSINLVQPGKETRIRILFDPPEHMILLRSRAVALQQILINILLNAIQQIQISYPDQGGWVHIWIEQNGTRPKQSYWRVCIEDNGPGIHTSQWEQIFDPGFSTRPGGSGIGLYISRVLIESLGGRLYVRNSRILGGTTFVIEIPNKM